MSAEQVTAKQARITAKEARELAQLDKTEEILAKIYERIREAATRGDTSIRFAGNANEMGVYQFVGGKQPGTPLGRRVVDRLRADGYKVTTYYEELQFVDLGLVISWEG